jgi:hypothetical protein
MFEHSPGRRPMPSSSVAPKRRDAGASPATNREWTSAAPAVQRWELSRIRTTADVEAPIQCVKWKWNATSNQWQILGSPPPAAAGTPTPPADPGAHDGEEFEDTYEQAGDRTAEHFLRPSDRFMGERGARQQLSGVTPSAEDIRVPAVQSAGLRAGAGLHEGVPTNMRGEVAASGNPVLVGVQSGYRHSTASQLFLQPGNTEVGAHTGYAASPTGHGSTHTRGQAPFHDELRAAVRSQLTQSDPVLAINAIALAQLGRMPSGQQVLHSGYVTGMNPTDAAIGTVGPPTTSGPPDAARLRLARSAESVREDSKDVARSLKRRYSRGQSPSPPRTPINDQGQGGDHVPGPRSTYRVVRVPSFPGPPGSFEHAANMAGFAGAPGRRGYVRPPSVPAVAPSLTPSTPTGAASSATAAAAASVSSGATSSSSPLPSLLMPPPPPSAPFKKPKAKNGK